MKNVDKLHSVNKKIALLNDKKLYLEKQIASSLSNQITDLLIKNHAININSKDFLKKIELIIKDLNHD